MCKYQLVLFLVILYFVYKKNKRVKYEPAIIHPAR